MTTWYSFEGPMPALINVRFERFAQEIVKGTPVRKAYAIAGYRANKGNASRLRLHQGIKARIEELVAQKTAAVEIAQLDAAARAGLDHYWVLRMLRRNSVLAARAGDRAASNRAAELIGRHLGMFIDKKQIEINHIDDADEYLQRILAIVNDPVIEHEPGLQQLASDGTECGSADQELPDPIDIIEESV